MSSVKHVNQYSLVSVHSSSSYPDDANVLPLGDAGKTKDEFVQIICVILYILLLRFDL